MSLKSMPRKDSKSLTKVFIIIVFESIVLILRFDLIGKTVVLAKIEDDMKIDWRLRNSRNSVDTFSVSYIKTNSNMDQSVYWNLELNIKAQKKSDLPALVADMAARTKEYEPGALNYEWQVNAEMTECHIFERYADSDALMTHLGNFQEHFADRFFDILEIKRWTVYGNPTDQVRETLGGFGAQFLDRIGGFSR